MEEDEEAEEPIGRNTGQAEAKGKMGIKWEGNPADKANKKRRYSEIPQLASVSESEPTEDEGGDDEAAVVQKIEAFDTAALMALGLSKEISRGCGERG